MMGESSGCSKQFSPALCILAGLDTIKPFGRLTSLTNRFYLPGQIFYLPCKPGLN